MSPQSRRRLWCEIAVIWAVVFVLLLGLWKWALQQQVTEAQRVSELTAMEFEMPDPPVCTAAINTTTTSPSIRAHLPSTFLTTVTVVQIATHLPSTHLTLARTERRNSIRVAGTR
jgi:hypothetical protein